MFVKPNKEGCRANATKDGFCFWHSKQTEQQRDQAVMDGGHSPKRSYGREDEITINSTQDVLRLITETINDLRQNNASTRMANAIGYLAGIALKSIDQGDLERRLSELEYAIKVKDGHSQQPR